MRGRIEDIAQDTKALPPPPPRIQKAIEQGAREQGKKAIKEQNDLVNDKGTSLGQPPYNPVGSHILLLISIASLPVRLLFVTNSYMQPDADFSDSDDDDDDDDDDR